MFTFKVKVMSYVHIQGEGHVLYSHTAIDLQFESCVQCNLYLRELLEEIMTQLNSVCHE